MKKLIIGSFVAATFDDDDDLDVDVNEYRLVDDEELLVAFAAAAVNACKYAFRLDDDDDDDDDEELLLVVDDETAPSGKEDASESARKAAAAAATFAGVFVPLLLFDDDVDAVEATEAADEFTNGKLLR